MIKSITNFLVIFFIFQQLKSQISKIYQNGYNPFCDETLQLKIYLWTVSISNAGHLPRTYYTGRIMKLAASFTIACSSSVASFLVLGGGGGDKPPKCTDRRKTNLVHVTYMRERASASETYRPIFSHMVWHYKRQFRTKKLTLRKSMNMRASAERASFENFRIFTF